MTKQSGYATKQTGYFWTKQLGLNNELTEDDVAKFKAVVQPLIDQYKEVYGADACTAFGVQ